MNKTLNPIYNNISFPTKISGRYILKIRKTEKVDNNLYYLTLSDNTDLLNIIYNPKIKEAKIALHLRNNKKMIQTFNVDDKTIRELENYLENNKEV